MMAAFDHACTKLKACPGADTSTFTSICDQFAGIAKMAPPQNCPAAKRCLDAIDNMSCTQTTQDVVTTVYTIQDCSSAITDC